MANESVTFKKEKTTSGLLVTLVGAIEENVDFESQMGSFQGVLQVNCRGINRINSVGVKMWMRYFQGLNQKKVAFEFLECSAAIVEQLNLISNFPCGGRVVSILLPYACSKCKKDFVASMTVAEIREAKMQIPALKCEKPECGAQFDDDPEEYLYFMDE